MNLPTPLSGYILTHNSEKHLSKIIHALEQIAEEIIVVDSGSTDGTEKIVAQSTKARFLSHPLSNFRDQRIYAEKQCQHNRIVFLDSDEIPDTDFIRHILQLKDKGFEADVYEACRKWIVLGKPVHCVYPVLSPDTPIRLYDKTKASFERSSMVHEAPAGFQTRKKLEGIVYHITFENRIEIDRKMELYTNIAARDLIESKTGTGWWKQILMPVASFVKWYFVMGGYKDGKVGLILSKYAFDVTYRKYSKARQMIKDSPQ